MIVIVGLHGRWPILNSSMAADRSMRPLRMQTLPARDMLQVVEMDAYRA